jgi:uncharacterized protein with HEPN domain
LSFKNPLQSLRDIVDAITSIEEFTSAMDFAGFRSDTKTVAAVERKLLVISEAAIRLDDQGPALCPDQPWPKIRGTGNWIRHQYDRIDVEDIWRTVTDDLPSLKASADRALASPPAG